MMIYLPCNQCAPAGARTLASSTALPLAIVAAGFLGFAAFCLFISDYVRAKNATSHESRFQQILIGFAILQVPVIGFFLGLIIDSNAMAIVFGIVSGMLLLIVFTASAAKAYINKFLALSSLNPLERK